LRLTIAAVGRIKGDPAADVFATYAERLPWPLSVNEIEIKDKRAPGERKTEEGKRLIAALPVGAVVVALDPKGKMLSTEAVADRLRSWRDGGIKDLAFVLGGADGLSEAVRERATLLLSLGPMTWPHLLARAMLAEQLYRASAILAGHPYHRGG